MTALPDRAADPSRPQARRWQHGMWLMRWILRCRHTAPLGCSADTDPASTRTATIHPHVIGRSPADPVTDGRTVGAGCTVVDICSVEDLDRSGRVVVRPGGLDSEVLVVRAGRLIYAVDNRCPHLGSALFGGTVRRGTITCPGHRRGFELTTGRCTSGYGRPLAVWRTLVENGRVLIADGARTQTPNH